MPRTCANFSCGKQYAVTEPSCPYCLTSNPQVETVQIPRSFRWASSSQSSVEITKYQGSTSTAIATIQQDISGMVPYTMKGMQSATTTVKQRSGVTRDFVTTDNMHSEMVALQHMLTAGEWRLSLGLVQWAHNGEAVDGSEFSTTAPHCGFCTVILEVLGLPLTSPTKGNYNLSCNFNYPLPDKVQNDPYVLARVLGRTYCAFDQVKGVLNAFVNAKPEAWFLQIMDGVVVNDHHYVTGAEPGVKVTWQEVVERGTVKEIWALIFKAIYSNNK